MAAVLKDMVLYSLLVFLVGIKMFNRALWSVAKAYLFKMYLLLYPKAAVI